LRAYPAAGGWLPASVCEFLEESFQFRFPTHLSITLEYLDLDVSVGKELHFPSLSRHVGHDHDRVIPIVLDPIVDLAPLQPAEEIQ
jgi:hypothetical protein